MNATVGAAIEVLLDLHGPGRGKQTLEKLNRRVIVETTHPSSSARGELAVFNWFMHRLPTAWQARLSEADKVELDRALDEFLDRARTDWPDLSIDPDGFFEFVAGRAPSASELASLRAGDLLLAYACLSNADGAVDRLRARLWPKVLAALRARGVRDDQAAEVEQRVWETLLFGSSPALASYAGLGDLRSWLRSVAIRTANRVVEDDSKRRRDRSDDVLDQLAGADDPEVEALKRLYRDEFAEAFREALRGLTAKQRNLLRQHYIDGLSIDRMGALYRVHRATAARWLAAARSDLFERTKRNLSIAVGATDSTVESIIRLVQSQLDISLHQYLS